VKDALIRIKRLLEEDWLLVLVALGVAVILWWNATQRQMATKFFPNVEVNLEGSLKPSLSLAPTQPTRPKVTVRVQGPKVYLDGLASDSFQINADLSDIKEATKQTVFLQPEDLVPRSHLIRALPFDQFKVKRPDDIIPSGIPVETVWNQAVAKIRPRLSGAPYEGYIISSTSVTPATLTVAGDKNELPLRKIIPTKTEIVLSGEKQMPDQFFSRDDLDLGDLEVLNWDPKQRIRLHIEIEPRFGEKKFRQVQIDVVVAPEDRREFDFDPKTVEVHLQGARAALQSVTNLSFALQIDLSRLETKTHALPTRLLQTDGLPSGVQVREATPAWVTVRIWEASDVVFPQPPTPPGDAAAPAGMVASGTAVASSSAEDPSGATAAPPLPSNSPEDATPPLPAPPPPGEETHP